MMFECLALGFVFILMSARPVSGGGDDDGNFATIELDDDGE